VEHTALVRAPLDAVWEFTRDLNNWAQYVTGYQAHTAKSEADSAWTLKGDVGALTRTVEIEVHITEWRDRESVEFELRGVNEPISGSGAFRLQHHAATESGVDPWPRRVWGLVGRAKDAVLRWLHRLVFRRGDRTQPGAAHAGGEALSEISFQLTLNAGGRAGPMINALLVPMLEPVAQDLASQIAARIEELHPAAAQ
jgi:carbon monoxide dehydrogenase subunit G